MTNDQHKSCNSAGHVPCKTTLRMQKSPSATADTTACICRFRLPPDGPEGRLTLASRRLTQASHMPSHLPQQAAMPVPGAFTQRSKMHSLSPREHVRPVEEAGDAVLSAKLGRNGSAKWSCPISATRLRSPAG